MAIDPTDHPLQLLETWLGEAAKSEPNDPTAMAMASVGEDGQPSLRMVLVRAWDERGVVFFTYLEIR